MRRSIIGLAVLALVCMGAYTVLAGGSQCSDPSAKATKVEAGAECSPTQTAAVGSPGNLTGRFDTAMSGVCRFGCATKIKYKAKDVIAQPGAKTGKLTQCPVSGVVFAVDANRPHVKIAGEEYVTCCDKCAAKLKKDPRHYLKA